MKKHSKQALTQDTELRTFSIRIKSDKLEKKLKNILLTYKHFENILLILINQNYNLYKEGKGTNDFNLLTSLRLITCALYDYNSKHSDKIEHLNNKYKDNQLWQELKETAKKLKSHNIFMVIKRVKDIFKAYFNSLETYKQNPSLFTGIPKPPKPKKLSKLTNYSIELNKYCSLSFAQLEKENLVGINLSNSMMYIHVDKRQVEKLTEIDRLYSARLMYDNGDLYLQISFKRGLFLDTVINKLFNADINGAVNHIKVAVGKSFIWLKDKLFKLCNPIKIRSDYEFCRLLKSLWNSGSGKSAPFVGAESSPSSKLIENVSFC